MNASPYPHWPSVISGALKIQRSLPSGTLHFSVRDRRNVRESKHRRKSKCYESPCHICFQMRNSISNLKAEFHTFSGPICLPTLGNINSDIIVISTQLLPWRADFSDSRRREKIAFSSWGLNYSSLLTLLWIFPVNITAKTKGLKPNLVALQGNNNIHPNNSSCNVLNPYCNRLHVKYIYICHLIQTL